ncbi:MAG: ArsR family transcriptional regulator [Candidatus Altiarchaeota archaeon]|nr:ArsR family transcriptional regulator [Candidatus Altiarchaeota archaeon]
MKRLDINILNSLWKKAGSVGELSERTGFSISYVSERINTLESRGFLSKKREGKRVIVSLNPHFSIHLGRLMDKFNLEMLFSGKKDILLLHLLKPNSVGELEKEANLSQAQIYKDLRGLKLIGAVRKIEGRYSINQEIKDLVRMIEFLREGELYRGVESGVIVLWREGEEILKKAPGGVKVRGVRTAFSGFSRAGVKYFPADEYVYQPKRRLSLEEVFVHSLVAAETKTQLAVCAVFFLKNRGGMDMKNLKGLCRRFHVLDLYLDMLSYLETREGDRFLPWGEFMEKTDLYGIQVKRFDEDFLVS